MGEWLDLVIHGGSSAVIVAAVFVLWKFKEYLDRRESLDKNYPPHLHVNGKVVYSKEYPPATIERLTAGD